MKQLIGMIHASVMLEQHIANFHEYFQFKGGHHVIKL